MYIYIYYIPFVQGCFAYQLSYHGVVGVVLDRQVCTQLMRKNDAMKATKKYRGGFGVKMRLKHQTRCQNMLKSPSNYSYKMLFAYHKP